MLTSFTYNISSSPLPFYFRTMTFFSYLYFIVLFKSYPHEAFFSHFILNFNTPTSYPHFHTLCFFLPLTLQCIWLIGCHPNFNLSSPRAEIFVCLICHYIPSARTMLAHSKWSINICCMDKSLFILSKFLFWKSETVVNILFINCSTSPCKISYSVGVHSDDDDGNSCRVVYIFNYESSTGWNLVFVLIYAPIHSMEIYWVLSMYQAP